jgi:hypothetical protein
LKNFWIPDQVRYDGKRCLRTLFELVESSKYPYWLLVIGYWLLVIGYWLLVIGY